MAEKNSLWKNIKASRGSSRKPTVEMLRQERKIKAKYPDGGPKNSYLNTPIYPVNTGSLYNPVGNRIHLDPNEPKEALPHEYYHAWQHEQGLDRIPELYDGPLRQPQTPYIDELTANYYNRTSAEENAINNEFRGQNPSFNFVPDDVMYDKYTNNEMYNRPYTMEGEARATESPEGRAWLKSQGILPQSIENMYKATGGYFPTQGPPKALFKGYADGGETDNIPTYRYANKEGIIGGPVKTFEGTKVPMMADGTPVVNLPEFEVISTPTSHYGTPNPYSPVTGEEFLSSGYNPINLFLPPQIEKQQQPIDPKTGMPFPQSGRADYDAGTEMMLVLPAANAVKKGSALLKNAKQELIYNAIDPVGYGVREKLGNIPQNLVRNTFKPNERIARVGKELSPFDLPGSEIVKSRGKARLDSWRLGLELDQKHNTFNKIGDNLYSTNTPNPIEGFSQFIQP